MGFYDLLNKDCDVMDSWDRQKSLPGLDDAPVTATDVSTGELDLDP
jgi:hypothetical protein